MEDAPDRAGLLAEIDRGLAEWLKTGLFPSELARVPREALEQRLDLHGLGPILALRVTKHAPPPPEILSMLKTRRIARELWEARHQKILTEALEVLRGAGLHPLLFKGTALAWSLYPTPAARVRGDSDILIEERGREKAIAALEAAGFSSPLSAGGHVLSAEILFQKADAGGELQDMDLHWRLNSSPILARVARHADLLRNATRVHGLGPHAQRVSNLDALFIACFHRQLHIGGGTHLTLNGVAHDTPDSLTWLLDIDLLFGALSRQDHERLARQAQERGLAQIVAEALRRCADLLGTPVEPDLILKLGLAAESPIDRYLAASALRRFSLNLGATPGLAGKRRFLKELLFPPEAYMRARFDRSGKSSIAGLYLRRAIGGIARRRTQKAAR